jgi:exopolyphosphatase / guanosine-5'-triphosphate,3'-diphosphate pyrophosphatase
MYIAIVDCGTNTFNLLIAQAKPEGWSVVFENKLSVKLGAGGFETKTIVPSRFIRGLDAINAHHENIKNFNCKRVFAFATSAVRESKNGQEFIKAAKDLTGIEIELIDGDREAELIYRGIVQTIDLGPEPSLIMDIGGGSTEFIIANNKEIFWKKSFLLGVSRLFDQLQPSDKMRHEEMIKLKSLLTKELEPLREALKQHKCKWLVGSSGSFDTLLSLFRHGAKQADTHPKLANDILPGAFPTIHNWLMSSTYEERLKHPAIPSIRAEFMPLASFMVKEVMEMQHFERLIHSQYALKEGAIMYACEGINWEEKGIEKEQPEDYLEE